MTIECLLIVIIKKYGVRVHPLNSYLIFLSVYPQVENKSNTAFLRPQNSWISLYVRSNLKIFHYSHLKSSTLLRQPYRWGLFCHWTSEYQWTEVAKHDPCSQPISEENQWDDNLIFIQSILICGIFLNLI